MMVVRGFSVGHWCGVSVLGVGAVYQCVYRRWVWGLSTGAEYGFRVHAGLSLPGVWLP